MTNKEAIKILKEWRDTLKKDLAITLEPELEALSHLISLAEAEEGKEFEKHQPTYLCKDCMSGAGGYCLKHRKSLDTFTIPQEKKEYDVVPPFLRAEREKKECEHPLLYRGV